MAFARAPFPNNFRRLQAEKCFANSRFIGPFRVLQGQLGDHGIAILTDELVCQDRWSRGPAFSFMFEGDGG
jgi:hypothetical protein